MMNFTKILVLLLLIPFTKSLLGQEVKVVKDFRFDGSLGVSKELFDVLEIGFESVIKLEKDASEIDEIDFDLDVTYSPFSFFSFGVGYRIAENRRKNGNYEINQRLSAELEFAAKVKRFKLEYRLRYQNVDDDFILYDETSPPEHILRNRLGIKYDIRNCKLTPFIYYEHYGKLDSPDQYGFRHKYAIGGRYSFGKFGKVKVFYRIIKELNNANPYTIYNLGLGYVYDF